MARVHAWHASLPRHSRRAYESAARRIHTYAHDQHCAPRMETFNDTPRRPGRAGGDVEMKSISPARQAGKMRSADFQSAVSQIYNLRGTDMPASRTILAPAERNSAIQQITNVRYI